MKSLPGTFSLAYKKRTFSPNRIKYPLIRVDWDPNGERNPQNRGKSKYRRVSWDEATTIIANEIRRIHKTYGPLGHPGAGRRPRRMQDHPHPARPSGPAAGHDGWLYPAGAQPDSWEGWYWGSKHVWGQGFQGMMSPGGNLVKDITREHARCCCSGAAIRRPRRGASPASTPPASATSGRRPASSRSTFAPI